MNIKIHRRDSKLVTCCASPKLFKHHVMWLQNMAANSHLIQKKCSDKLLEVKSPNAVCCLIVNHQQSEQAGFPSIARKMCFFQGQKCKDKFSHKS